MEYLRGAQLQTHVNNVTICMNFVFVHVLAQNELVQGDKLVLAFVGGEALTFTF